jgi:hypothetical protein
MTKVGDFGYFGDQWENEIGFITEIDLENNMCKASTDYWYTEFRFLTEEEKQVIQDNWKSYDTKRKS